MELLNTIDLARLHIVKYPHPVLAGKAQPVIDFDPRLADLAERMYEIMHAARGVGLAAPQVAAGVRMFVGNPTGVAGPDDTVFINPDIIDRQGQTVEEEGCLSCPGIHTRVKRSTQVTVRAAGLDGEVFELSAEGLLARIVQHELDHLNGTLIIDRMSTVAKLSNRRTIKELEDAYAAGPT